MIHFNQKTLAAIDLQTQKAMQATETGATIREILCELYIQGLPDKTKNQGNMMADRVIQTIARYTTECEEAISDADGWARNKLGELLEGKQLEERCDILFQITVGLEALNAESLAHHMMGDGNSAEEILTSLSDKQLAREAINEDLESALYQQAIDNLKNNGVLFAQMENMAQMLESLKQGKSITHVVVESGVRAADQKAIASMIAYVMAKNGSLDELPEDMSIDDITISVCAAYEIQRIAALAEDGSLTANIALLMIKVIGMVAVGFVMVSVFTFSFAFISSLLGGALGILSAIPFALGVCALVGKPLIRGADSITTGVANVTIALVSHAVNGMGKLLGWASEHIFPTVKNALEQSVSFALSLISKGIAVLTDRPQASATLDA